jgi:hypothetical protein
MIRRSDHVVISTRMLFCDTRQISDVDFHVYLVRAFYSPYWERVEMCETDEPIGDPNFNFLAWGI